MPKFGTRSLNERKTLHPLLKEIADEAIKHFDFTILCGYRDKKAQMEAYNKGTSKLKFPYSKHNVLPSLAMDLAPFPIDWHDVERFEMLAKLILWIAEDKKITIVWGGNWKTFRDLPHFELRINPEATILINEPCSFARDTLWEEDYNLFPD